jgi:hypothetical protein
MRNILILVAASAALSASILTGLASADVSTTATGRVGPSAPAPMPAAAPRTVWTDPPSRPAQSCPATAWPYGQPACTAERADVTGLAPARRVRLIRLDGPADRIDVSRPAASASLARR